MADVRVVDGLERAIDDALDARRRMAAGRASSSPWPASSAYGARCVTLDDGTSTERRPDRRGVGVGSTPEERLPLVLFLGAAGRHPRDQREADGSRAICGRGVEAGGVTWRGVVVDEEAARKRAKATAGFLSYVDPGPTLLGEMPRWPQQHAQDAGLPRRHVTIVDDAGRGPRGRRQQSRTKDEYCPGHGDVQCSMAILYARQG